MDDIELGKYLNSLILCIQYYYHYNPTVFYMKMERKTTDISIFAKEINLKKTIYYSPQNNIYSNNLDFIKNHLRCVLNSSETKTTDYLIKHLKSILDEYITKNNLDYIEINYIVGTSLVDGYGRILIQTQTNTFTIVIQAY